MHSINDEVKYTINMRNSEQCDKKKAGSQRAGLEYIQYVLLPFGFDCSLRRSQTCDRHPERRAGHIVHADLVAELYGCGISSVLAADTYLQFRVSAASALYAYFKQFSDRLHINGLERIGIEELVLASSAALGISIIVP